MSETQYRCKDCKHIETITRNGETTSYCNDKIEHRAQVDPESSACESFKHLDPKDIFWGWLIDNSNIYFMRKHHKTDINTAIDYMLSKLIILF